MLCSTASQVLAASCRGSLSFSLATRGRRARTLFTPSPNWGRPSRRSAFSVGLGHAGEALKFVPAQAAAGMESMVSISSEFSQTLPLWEIMDAVGGAAAALPEPEVSTLEKVIGLGVLIALAILLPGTLRRRMSNARAVDYTSRAQRAADRSSQPAADEENEKPATVGGALTGAAIAAVVAYFIWQFTQGVDAKFASQPLSNQYTVRNITITVRTIISGICYLGVFVFGTNAIGLIAYAIQLATNGPEEPVAKPPAPEKPELPPIKGLYRTTKQDVDAQNSNPDS